MYYILLGNEIALAIFKSVLSSILYFPKLSICWSVMCSFPLKVQDSVCSFQMFKTSEPLYKGAASRNIDNAEFLRLNLSHSFKSSQSSQYHWIFFFGIFWCSLAKSCWYTSIATKLQSYSMKTFTFFVGNGKSKWYDAQTDLKLKWEYDF